MVKRADEPDAARRRLRERLRGRRERTGAEPVFHWREHTPRILASNTKLFTTTAALARFGADGTLGTEVLGTGELDAEGVYRGSLYLRGGGDPTFGSRRFTSRSYGGGATVQDLAEALDEAGIERVTGRVYGDESRLRLAARRPRLRLRRVDLGRPAERAVLQPRPVHARAAAASRRTRPRSRPRGSTTRSRRATSRCGCKPRAGVAPAEADRAGRASTRRRCRGSIRLTNKPSDNFFAEMLLKDLATQAGGVGTTRAAARRIATRFARRLGARPRIVDGSGLSRADRASPFSIVQLLAAMRSRAESDAFLDSLSDRRAATARSFDRMRRGPAHRRCTARPGRSRT